MAEARINPQQLQDAVNVSVKRALERDTVIRGPILIGIIAYPDQDRVFTTEIQAINPVDTAKVQGR